MQLLHISERKLICAARYKTEKILKSTADLRGSNQKFPDWPPGATTVNGTALGHYMQLYRYFLSQSNEFYLHNPLCCFSTNVYCCYFVMDSVRKLVNTS